MQSPRSNVFGLLIHARGKIRNSVNRVFSEIKFDAFRFHQRLVLFHQRVLWFNQNALEIFDGQRLEFDPNWKTSLKFRNQVGGFRNMKCAGGNEQNVIGAHHAVACVDSCSFDNWQDVALHSFARNVRAMSRLAACDLVNLIEEDNA